MKKIKSTDSIKMYKQILQGKSFLSKLIQKKSYSIPAYWNAFKRFALEVSIDCNDDALLFELYNKKRYGNEVVYLGFVRQYTFDIEKEYDHMEQFSLSFLIPLSDLPIEDEYKKTLWTYDFAGDRNKFFAEVEGIPEFAKLLANNEKLYTSLIEFSHV